MRSSHSLFFFVTNAPKPTKSLFWFKKAFEVFSRSQNSADTEDKLASDSRIVFSLVRPPSNLPKSSSAAKLLQRHVMYLLLSCCGARSIESPPQLSQVWCFACPRSPWKKKEFNNYIFFGYYVFLIETHEMLILGQTSAISKIRLLREVPLALVAKINPLIKLVTRFCLGEIGQSSIKAKELWWKSSVWPPRLWKWRDDGEKWKFLPNFPKSSNV